MSYVQTSNITVGSSFSMSVWFKVKTGETMGNDALLASTHYYTATYDGNFVLRITSATKIAFTSYNGIADESSKEFDVTLETGVWYNVIVACNGTILNLYLDGADMGSVAHTKALDDIDDGGLVVGADLAGPNNTFIGHMDEVALWDSHLSASDAASIYNLSCPTDLALYSPLGWWRMGDGDDPVEGTDNPTTVTDQGSAGSDATLNDSPLYRKNAPAVYHLDSSHGICQTPIAHWDASDMNGNGDDSFGWSDGSMVSDAGNWVDRTETFLLKQYTATAQGQYLSGGGLDGFNGHPVVGAGPVGAGENTRLNIFQTDGVTITGISMDYGEGAFYTAGMINGPTAYQFGTYLWAGGTYVGSPKARIYMRGNQSPSSTDPDTVISYSWDDPLGDRYEFQFDTNEGFEDKSAWIGIQNSGKGTEATGINVRYRQSGNPTVTMPSQTAGSTFSIATPELPIYTLSISSANQTAHYNYAEMLFFNSGLSFEDQTTLESYLSTKYDIPDS